VWIVDITKPSRRAVQDGYLFDLEGETLKIVKAIASMLDHFDLVVQTLQATCVVWIQSLKRDMAS
jgi:hypothetical protein